MKSIPDYVFKIKVEHKYLFQCGYDCWTVEKRREYENHGPKKDKF